MYKNTLTVYGEHLAKAQSLPADASAEGNGGARRAGSMLGAAEVVMVAASSVTLAEGTTLTLMMQQSTDGETFTDIPVQFRKTVAASSMNVAAGEVMARLPLPSDAGSFVRAVMATDDAAATGSVDIIFEYLPR